MFGYMSSMGKVKTKTGKTAKKQPKPLVRKHEGIVQRGPKRGKLKKGYKYSGEKNVNGLSKIVKA